MIDQLDQTADGAVIHELKYTYDAENNRIAESSGGIKKEYVIDPQATYR